MCLLISLALLAPCFWHAHIEAGDLGSHVYNAWLAQLVQQGRAPGVYTVWQWDNILFDLMLSFFGKAFGLTAAEKIAVSICVLIFFWGLFAFMRAVSGKPPWLLTPCIAMLSYSYIFHMGFMNYYLSLGLASIGLALAWPARKNGLIAAALLAPFMLLAHPLGFLWFLGTAAYRLLWLRFPGAWKLVLPATAIVILVVAREFVAHHHGYEVEWRETPIWELNGADQFHVFGYRYVWFTIAMAVFVLTASAIAFFGETQRLRFWKDRRLILELYFISFCATALLPENLHTDPTGGWIGALVTRLTLDQRDARLLLVSFTADPRLASCVFRHLRRGIFHFYLPGHGFSQSHGGQHAAHHPAIAVRDAHAVHNLCSQRLPHHLSAYSRSRLYRALFSGFELRAVHEAVPCPCPARKPRGRRV